MLRSKKASQHVQLHFKHAFTCGTSLRGQFSVISQPHGKSEALNRRRRVKQKQKNQMKKMDEDLAEHYVKVACGVDEFLRRMYAPAEDDYAIN